MRSREEIEESINPTHNNKTYFLQPDHRLLLEVLLDIRDLLIERKTK